MRIVIGIILACFVLIVTIFVFALCRTAHMSDIQSGLDFDQECKEYAKCREEAERKKLKKAKK